MTSGQQILIDCTTDNHIHTLYCRHASGSMEDYVQSAIRKGLHKINFLEHMEIGIQYFERVWLEEEDFDSYFHEGRQLQEKYKNHLAIGIGVEAGYNREHREELIDRLSKRSWDRIGLSCHFTRVEQAPYHLNLVSRQARNVAAFTEIGCQKLLDDYFSDLYDAVNCIPADFVCHIDAALRHQPNFHLSHSNYQQISGILKLMKQNDMALEINTSGFTMRGEPFPNRTIIKMAMNEDIAFVAGSDAHKPEDIGRSFDQLPGLLTEIKNIYNTDE